MSPERQFDIVSRLEQQRQQEKTLTWEGPFRDYFDLALENPKIARLSHARVYDMIMSKGVEVKNNGEKSYNFFTEDLYGIEKPIQQIADYFASSAKRLEVRKRILLLMGPVGGGKSTLATLLKRGLEDYTKTEEGAVYVIKDCPMNEEPLHLVPDEVRPELIAIGLHIEGDLCPACVAMVRDKYEGKAEDVRVVRTVFSEKKRVGIGTFTPSDPKSQDISELTGSIDLATIGQFGSESDPRAYRFDGELNIANRGMMEFIEMLKCDEKFLYNLLTLSQEQNIKTGRFAMIYADEVIMSHTNEHEYQGFINNKKSEALHDRIILVKVPYNLRVSDEVKIYEKMIKDSNLTGVHIAPHSLRVASMFAVLSRLEESKKEGMSLIKKMRLYDGEEVDEFNIKDVKEIKDETEREGMEGISPRFVINSLSNALAKEDIRCINPIDALRAIRNGLEQHASSSKEEKERLKKLIGEVRKEYDDLAKTEVQRAFVHSFEESAKTLARNYLDNVVAFSTNKKIKDPITEEDVEPDELLMRSIEDQIGISENQKKSFRNEILIRLSALALEDKRFEYTSHDRLRDAIEKKLFADLKDVVKITTSTRTPDPDQLKKINDVARRLEESHKYCNECSNELLKYVGTLLNR